MSFFQKTLFSKAFKIAFLSVFIPFSSFASELTNKEAEKQNYSQETVSNYAKFNIQGTSWLTFRDVPGFVKQYVKGEKTLDYGCGAGRSTRFLKTLGLSVEGVDISQKFLNEALSVGDQTKYFLLECGKIPTATNTYDFVFSSHVLLMVPTKEELAKVFKEIHRVLKKDGIFIAVTSSEEMHSPKRNWISYETDFPENQNFGSGSIVKLVIKGVNAVFFDYNWTNEDYSELLKANGFEILETHFPLGKEGEGFDWLSEKECSPYVMYVAKKC